MEKDIILAVLGASVGLAGLLLVFSGFVFTQAAGFPPAHTDDETIKKYRNAGRFGVWPFLFAILNAALSVAWLLWQSSCLYGLTVTCFFVLLAFTGVYGAIVLRSYL